jgi:hypothetical protein
MNPVMSDLEVFVRKQEIEASTRSLLRAQLVREAKGLGDGRGWFRRLAHRVHEFVDPRGFALAQVQETAAAPAEAMVEPATAHLSAMEAVRDTAERVCLSPEREQPLAA